MRKLFIILSVLFTILGVVLSVLPFDTLAYLPIGLALVFSLLTLKVSKDNQKKFIKILLLLSAASSMYVLGKTLLIKDEVEKDVKFEQQKIEIMSKLKLCEIIKSSCIRD
jgi:hypothetical protein